MRFVRLLSSYSVFFYLLIAANFRRSRSFFASIQAIPFLSPTILCFRPRKSIIGFVYLSLKKSVPFVLPIMHFYKTLLVGALMVASAVAQLQFTSFPPSTVAVGQSVTVTWSGAAPGVRAISPSIDAYPPY